MTDRVELAWLARIAFNQEQANGPAASRLIREASLATLFYTDDDLEAHAARLREQAIDTLPEVADDGEE